MIFGTRPHGHRSRSCSFVTFTPSLLTSTTAKRSVCRLRHRSTQGLVLDSTPRMVYLSRRLLVFHYHSSTASLRLPLCGMRALPPILTVLSSLHRIGSPNRYSANNTILSQEKQVKCFLCKKCLSEEALLCRPCSFKRDHYDGVRLSVSEESDRRSSTSKNQVYYSGYYSATCLVINPNVALCILLPPKKISLPNFFLQLQEFSQCKLPVACSTSAARLSLLG